MEEKPKGADNPDARITCPICGNTDFRWGVPASNGGVWFSPISRTPLYEGLIARACNSCGNVQLFLKNSAG